MPAVGLARLLRLYATDYVIFSRVFHGKTPCHQRGYYYFVVIVRGETYARAGEFGCAYQKIVRRTVPYPYREGRLRQKDVFGSRYRHKRQIVGNVFAFRVLTAGDQVLEKRISRETLRRIFIPALVEIVEFNPYTVHKFLRELSGHTALAGFKVIRVHILVESSGRN